MLVLRRLAAAGDRSVICISDPRIGDHITLTVLATRGELVELAVDAPPGVAVTLKSSVPSRRKPIAASNAEKTQSNHLFSPAP